MPVTKLPFANGFYVSDSLPISAQECTNWYPNLVQTEGLNNETLFGTPGLEQVGTIGPSPQVVNRGANALDGTPYFVNGPNLVRLNPDESTTMLGTIEGMARVSMDNNGKQLMILIPGGKGYIFTENPDLLVEITDVDFNANGAPQLVVFLDGFFICTTDEKKFIISAINDGTSWNALDFGTAESSPDDTVVPIVYKNQLFIAGTGTFEVFNNVGGADFPFQRTGLFFDEGVDAPFSIVHANDTFMFIGGGINESPAIWQLQGNNFVKVSTTAIDSILQRFTLTEIQSSFSWSYAQKGGYFVGFALPTTCLVLDTVTGRWHERKSQIDNPDGTKELVRFRINSLVAAYGKVYVGDSQDGRIGSMDVDVFSEYGGDIIRRFATQPFQNNMQAFFVPTIELTVESGVGDANTPDPKIRMDRSLDGKTFSDEITRSIGKVGAFKHRAIWRRNGRVARFEVLRFTMSDQVKPVVIQLTADVVGGT